MDTNKRKTGLARLIEIAGTKRRLLIGAMLLAVITAKNRHRAVCADHSGVQYSHRVGRACA